jgi:hypothetical protein
LRPRGALEKDKWTAVDREGKLLNYGFDGENGQGLFVPQTNQDIWFNAPSKFSIFKLL